MPKGKGGKDKKKKEPKKPKMIGNETLGQIVRRLQRSYEKNCTEMGLSPSSKLVSQMKTCIEEEALLENFILAWNEKAMACDPPVTLEPLIASLRSERYNYLQDFRTWNVPIDHVNAASLALLVEKGSVPFRRIELMDCLLSASALARLCSSFPKCFTLNHLCLDYNEFGDEGCRGLCKGLEGTRTLLSLSLNYCGLGVSSGKLLGHILATTTVRELFLDGNDLGCAGAVALIAQCSVSAEIETTERLKEAKEAAEAIEEAERLEKENRYNKSAVEAGDNSAEVKPEAIEKPAEKKKKGKKKKGKEPPPPPTPGPYIHKLHLADNGIDGMKAQSLLTSNVTDSAPLHARSTEPEDVTELEPDALTLFIREISRLIMYSEGLEELDLEDNLIGDLGGLRLLDALKKREELGLQGVKVQTTHRMHPDTFNEIVKLASGLKKKKKKKGKKK